MVKMRQHSDTEKKTKVIGPSPYIESIYLNAFEDPSPVPAGITPPKDFEVHNKALAAFEDKLYDAFYGLFNEQKELRTDFIFTFCPHSIISWPKVQSYKWYLFLQSREAHVGNRRETPRVEALKRLLFRKCFFQVKPMSTLERAAHKSFTRRETSLVAV